VFEIGSSLRAAREHQGLELSAVERETRIRTKYLQALEDERFALLPGTAYVKGFLRTYADFLGLDGMRFVEEYNERFAPAEPLEAAPPVRVRRPRQIFGARLVAIPVAVAVGLFVWRLTSGGAHRLWIRIGAPWNVDASLNGKRTQLPATTGNVLVTPASLRSLGS
jgi:cytoskeletal protein RodZ